MTQAPRVRQSHSSWQIESQFCGPSPCENAQPQLVRTSRPWRSGSFGQKRRTVREQMERDSRRVIEHAVKGMLQGNKLGSAQYRNLYVYAGDQHPHEAQQPVAIELKNL